jgi:hypothetical protein
MEVEHRVIVTDDESDFCVCKDSSKGINNHPEMF